MTPAKLQPDMFRHHLAPHCPSWRESPPPRSTER